MHLFLYENSVALNERRLNVYDMRDNSSDVAGDSVWGVQRSETEVEHRRAALLKTIKLYKPEICV